MEFNLNKVFCEWPCWEETISQDAFQDKIAELSSRKAELLSLWGSDDRPYGGGFNLHLFFVFWETGTLYLKCPLSLTNPEYPDLSRTFPVADRLQRAVYDLLGFKALGNEDTRPWLRHDAWPKDWFPLRVDNKITDHFNQNHEEYAFTRVRGEGVHEIPVGPVHAGIIEPGHFRFHVVGEHILRLEERLGYAHKGIDKHFQGASLEKGVRIAGRLSCDSTAAYSWAFSMALENAHKVNAPHRATWLRALLLERERVANHLSDLGSLGKDAGLGFAHDQFSRIKENVLRSNYALFQCRYPMDLIVPGGLSKDISPNWKKILTDELHDLTRETSEMLTIFREHGGLQDRFVSAGMIKPDLAYQLGLLGFSARASRRPIDWRNQMPHEPYSKIKIQYLTEKDGDVAARVTLRFKELFESYSAIRQIMEHAPEGRVHVELPKAPGVHTAFGCVEGWRGPVFAAVCCKDSRELVWAHMHDPSWQNWPALEFAVIGDIVPDFPLINKSFNLSYSGHDC